MIFQDLRKGWPLIVLGLIALMSLIRGCAIIMSPDQSSNNIEGGIRHVVFLDLKPDTDINDVIQEIQKIREVEGLMDLEVGPFKDLGDDRALSHFELAFSMNFKNERDYQRYQKDSIHLKLKVAITDMLAGPPVTYDFELK